MHNNLKKNSNYTCLLSQLVIQPSNHKDTNDCVKTMPMIIPIKFVTIEINNNLIEHIVPSAIVRAFVLALLYFIWCPRRDLNA